MPITIKKNKVGFLLTGDYLWIGGLYYVLNLLKALTFQSTNNIEFVALVSKTTPKDVIKELESWDISYLSIDEFSLFSKVLFSYPKRLEKLLSKNRVSAVFPILRPDSNFEHTTIKNIYWIPDFQDKFFPGFFSNEELARRNRIQESIASSNSTLILSSGNAKKHFESFYTNYQCSIEILRFRSIILKKNLSEKKMTLSKYNVKTPYFLVCNQFWKHKNHKIVVEAARALKESGVECRIIMTGKADSQFPEVYSEIEKYIHDNNLSNIQLVGLIPREEQLCLMKHCIAVIQPSKFEGWSTVIEDARTLHVPVIASNLEVNKEQMQNTAQYFDIDDFHQLQNLMSGQLNISHVEEKKVWSEDFEDYALQLSNMFNRICL